MIKEDRDLLQDHAPTPGSRHPSDKARYGVISCICRPDIQSSLFGRGLPH